MGLSRPHGYEAERDLWVQVHKLWQEMGPDSDRAHLLGYPPDPAATPHTPDPAATPKTLAPPPTPVSGTASSDVPPAAPEPSRIRRVIADLTLGSHLSFAVLGWTLFLGVVAALLAGTRNDPPLAARELPAYHQLTAADLRGDPGDLLGRYTLRKIPAYGRLHPALLGPALSSRAPGGAAITLEGRVATVVSFPAGSTQSLQRGDYATLIAKKEPAIDVLVLDVLSADHVVLAMLPADLSRLADMPAPIQIAKHLS